MILKYYKKILQQGDGSMKLFGNSLLTKQCSRGILTLAAVTAMACLVASMPQKASAACTPENDYRQGKVYTITPNSKPTKESNYQNSKVYYNKNTKAYFTIRSYMEKFQKAKKGTLILKKGTYKITNTIQIPSNVTLILEDGVKIVKGTKTNVSVMPASKTLFHLIKPSNRDKSNVYGGHNGEKNIHIVGKGKVTVDLKYVSHGIGIVMGHNKDVTVDNISFKNINSGHFLEIDASKNVSITNCSFKDAKAGSDYVKEAINIDTPDKETQGFNNAWSKHDKTPNENITIANCTFTNMGRAIGTHKYSCKGNKQMYHENIVIRDCEIKDMKWDAPIRIINWKDSVVENVLIDKVKPSKNDSARGILACGVDNISIKNNTFIGMNRPIQIFPWKNIGPGDKYPVTYNKLTAENLEDLKSNSGSDLFEYFVRISEEYEDYTYPEIVYFN